MMSMRTGWIASMLGCSLFFGLFQEGFAQDKAGEGGFDSKVAAAWKRSGFESGWFALELSSEVFRHFKLKKADLPNGMPCFGGWPVGNFKNLPEPKEDFAVSFDPMIVRKAQLLNTPTSDAWIKELQRFKHLRCLSIGIRGNSQGMKLISQMPSLETLVLSLARDNPAQIQPLSELTQLKSLIIKAGPLTKSNMPAFANPKEGAINDDDLKVIANLKQLELLDLRNANLTDQGLSEIAKLTNLEVLDLSFTAITDAGLKHLANMPKLKSLYLCNNAKISNKGILALGTIKSLEKVWVNDTFVTTQGIEELKKALPNVTVIRQ